MYLGTLRILRRITTGTNTRIVHLLAQNTLRLQRYNESCDTLCSWSSRSYCCHAVVGKDAVCDPFLGPVDYIMVAATLSSGCQVRYI
ncbi:putative Acyl-CoA dehydrogenase conserved site [Alternaria alternata]|nr:putative Acyl-CoA dehydrogenase conserved site [Alternaria alternata]